MASNVVQTAYLMFRAKMGKSWSAIGKRIKAAVSSAVSNLKEYSRATGALGKKTSRLASKQKILAQAIFSNKNTVSVLGNVMLNHAKNFLTYQKSSDKARQSLSKLTGLQKQYDKAVSSSSTATKPLIGGFVRAAKAVKLLKDRGNNLNSQLSANSKNISRLSKKNESYAVNTAKVGKLVKRRMKLHKSWTRSLINSIKQTGRHSTQTQSLISVYKDSASKLSRLKKLYKTNNSRRKQYTAAVKKAQKAQENMKEKLSETHEAGSMLSQVLMGLGAKAVMVLSAVAAIVASATAAFGGLAMMAGNLSHQMSEVATVLSEDVRSSLSFLEDQVVSTSSTYGMSTQIIAKGLYQIVSAQVDVADTAHVMKISAQAATAGFVQMRTAADAITTILNAYQVSAREASRVSDLLFMTVRKGKITFKELSAQIGRVAAQASLANVSMEDFNAAIAVMTQAGIKSSVTMTSLTAMLRNLLSPSLEASRMAMMQFNTTLGSTALKEKGLIGIMKDLKGATAEQIRAIFSSQRAFRGAAALIENINGLQSTYNSMLNSAGTRQSALAEVTEEMNFQLSRLWQNLKNAAATMGRYAKASEFASDIIESVSDKVSKFIEYMQDSSKAVGEWKTLIKVVKKGLKGISNLVMGTIVFLAAVSTYIASWLTTLSAALTWFGETIGKAINWLLDLETSLEGTVKGYKKKSAAMAENIAKEKESISAARSHVNALEDLYQAQQRNVNAVDVARRQQRLMNEMQKLGVSITKQQIDSEKELARVRAKLAGEEVETLGKEQRRIEIDFALNLKAAQKKLDKFAKSGMGLGNQWSKQIDSVEDFKHALTVAQNNLSQMYDAMKKDGKITAKEEKRLRNQRDLISEITKIWDKASKQKSAYNRVELKKTIAQFNKIQAASSKITLGGIDPTDSMAELAALESKMRSAMSATPSTAKGLDLAKKYKKQINRLNRIMKMKREQKKLNDGNNKAIKDLSVTYNELAKTFKEMSNQGLDKALSFDDRVLEKKYEILTDTLPNKIASAIESTEARIQAATSETKKQQLSEQKALLEARKKRADLAIDRFEELIRVRKEEGKLTSDQKSEARDLIKMVRELANTRKNGVGALVKQNQQLGKIKSQLQIIQNLTKGISTNEKLMNSIIKARGMEGTKRAKRIKAEMGYHAQIAEIAEMKKNLEKERQGILAGTVSGTKQQAKILKGQIGFATRHLNNLKRMGKQKWINTQLAKEEAKAEEKAMKFGAKRMQNFRAFAGGAFDIKFEEQEPEKETADNTKDIADSNLSIEKQTAIQTRLIKGIKKNTAKQSDKAATFD